MTEFDEDVNPLYIIKCQESLSALILLCAFLQKACLHFKSLRKNNFMMYSQPGGARGIEPEIHGWFSAVDADHSGRITATELQQALTNADWSSFGYEACKLIIKIFDRNNTGTIGIGEFQAILQYLRQWQATFAQYDRDRSGFIESQELHQALASMNYRLSQDFTSLLVGICDPKNRRRISMDNFIMICIKLHIYTESFRTRDVQMKGEIDLKYEEVLSIVFENL